LKVKNYLKKIKNRKNMDNYKYNSKIYDEKHLDSKIYTNHTYLIDKYIKKFKLNKKILDIACGTGTDILKLNKKGYDCTGIDTSKSMIKKAIYKNKKYKSKFIIGDFKKKIIKNYPMITCLFNAIPEIANSNKDLNYIFKKVYNQLNKNGLFIFDYFKISKQSNSTSLKKYKLKKKMIYRILDNKIKKNKLYSEFIYIIKKNKKYTIRSMTLNRLIIKDISKVISYNKFEIIEKGDLFKMGSIVYILKKS